jgi:bacteriorhodopsin
MAVLYMRGNDALNVNPPPASDQFLLEHGSDWLWAVTAIYAVAFVSFFALSYFARAGEKVFHYIFTIALLVGTISYFAQASDLGWSVVTTVNDPDNGATRQIFFAKYVNWVVSFPAVILSLGLVSGVSWATILYNIFLSWTWVISFLVGAYTMTNYKWGFFAFGTIAALLLCVNTNLEGLAGAKRVGLKRDHGLLNAYITFLWILYPLAWGLSDGGNEISVTSGFIFFGILDVLMVPLFSFAFLFLSRNWDYGQLNIAFTQYGRVNARAGVFPEKEAPPATGALQTA